MVSIPHASCHCLPVRCEAKTNKQQANSYACVPMRTSCTQMHTHTHTHTRVNRLSTSSHHSPELLCFTEPSRELRPLRAALEGWPPMCCCCCCCCCCFCCCMLKKWRCSKSFAIMSSTVRLKADSVPNRCSVQGRKKGSFLYSCTHVTFSPRVYTSTHKNTIGSKF